VLGSFVIALTNMELVDVTALRLGLADDVVEAPVRLLVGYTRKARIRRGRIRRPGYRVMDGWPIGVMDSELAIVLFGSP
jgi:hypothetical protein